MILLKIDKLSDYIVLFIYNKNYLYRAGPGPVKRKSLVFFVVLIFCSSKCLNNFFMHMDCFCLKNVLLVDLLGIVQNSTSL